MRKSWAAWAVVLSAGVGGYYLSAWLSVPLVRLFAAHTSPGAATLIMLLQLCLWLVVIATALVLVNRFFR